MEPFRPRKRGVEVKLGDPERELLVHLLKQLDDLLDERETDSSGPGVSGTEPGAGGATVDSQPGDGESDEFAALAASTGLDAPAGSATPPDDPALARLLPNGHPDDPELAAEFRRLTEQGLRARKRSAAQLAAEALGRPHPLLQPTEAQALVKSMTDLRLVLGERLGLRTDDDAEQLHRDLVEGHRDQEWITVALTYDALTWWQESLIGALSRR